MFGKKKEDFSSVELFVGKGTELVGNITVEGSAIVEGRIKGDVEVKGELIVETDGKIESKIVRAGSVVCAGEIRTEELVAKRVEFKGTGKFTGNLKYKVLVVEEGATVSGNVSPEENHGVQAQDKG